MRYRLPLFPLFIGINLLLGLLSAFGLHEARLAVSDARSCRADVAAMLEAVRGFAASSSPVPGDVGPASAAPSGAVDAVADGRRSYIDDRRPIPDGWRLLSDARGWALYCDAYPSVWYHRGDLSPFGLIEDIGPHWFFAHDVLYVVQVSKEIKDLGS